MPPLKAKLHDIDGHLWQEVTLPPDVKELPKIIHVNHVDSLLGPMSHFYWRNPQTQNTYHIVTPLTIKVKT